MATEEPKVIEEENTTIMQPNPTSSVEEMVMIHDEDFLEGDKAVNDPVSQSEVQEIDLTSVDLETQRLKGMCRVCAKSRGKLHPVFGEEKNGSPSITEKIHSFLPILVTPEDLLPVSICGRCLACLDQSQKLVQVCIAADKKLRELLEDKFKESAEVEIKSEIDDDGDLFTRYDDDYSISPVPSNKSPSRKTPPPEDASEALKESVTKTESVTAAPRSRSPPPLAPIAESTPRPSRKSAVTSRLKPKPKCKTEPVKRRTEVAMLESSLPKGITDIDSGNSKVPNILRRRTRQSKAESFSPSIMEKMRSYGIKEASVVMTKVDIPQNRKSTVVTTVSVPITKEKPKSRAGPRRLYRCLYCSETGSDAYKLLLHQMKMHPGNLLKCPHCGFVCGSDQRAKYDAHVSAHSASGTKTAESLGISILPSPLTKDPGPSLEVGGPEEQAEQSKRKPGPKSKSLLKNKGKKAVAQEPDPKLPANITLPPNLPIVAQMPGSAIMLQIRVDGKPIAGVTPTAAPAIIPVTLYQCARCRMNFNTKEGVENHSCGTNLVPIAPKPGMVPIAPKPGTVNFPCTTCGSTFNDAAVLREHLLTHYQSFKCDVCEATFRSEFHLKQHGRKHNPENKSFKCPQCDKVYSLKSRLRVHLHSHSNEPRCVCPQCGKVFRTDGGFRNHLKAHENKRAFACSVCGLRFNRRGNMRRHERNCDGKKSLTCKYCLEKFDQHDELLVHRASAHPDLEMTTLPPIPIPDVGVKDKEKRYTCKVCDEGFFRVMDLRKHQLASHTEEELNKVKDVPDGGAYLCHTCGKQLHHKHNYKLHMMHHLGKALFKCSQCDRTFTSKFALHYHMMLHTGDFPYKCTMCSESFRSSVALQVHRFKHTGEKPYRCRSCDMGFFTSHSLRLHQVVHSTERNYVCKVCGSTFKRRKTLHYHSLIHTGEKPYKCKICGKAFRQKGTCNIHERNHAMPSRKLSNRTSTDMQRNARVQIDEEAEIDDNVDMEEGADMIEGIEVDCDEEIEERIEEVIEDGVGVEMEIDDTVHQTEEHQQVWRIADPKLQYRAKNTGNKNPTSSEVNEAIFVLRDTDGTGELTEVSAVQAEVIDSGLLSMYPDMQIQDAEIVESSEGHIEFTTPDGSTIRIIH